MPWTLVQANSNETGASGTTAVAFPNPVTAGNLLIACLAQENNPSGVVTCSDTLLNSWGTIDSLYDNASTQQANIWFWAIANGTGSTTVTFPGQSGLFAVRLIGEFSAPGGFAPNTIDQNSPLLVVSSGSTTDSLSSNSVTTAENNELIVGLTQNPNTSDLYAPGTNYSEAQEKANSQGLVLEFEYLTQTLAGAIVATWTPSASHRALTSIATFTVTATAPQNQLAWITA